MAKKIYISPSNQYDNLYAYGNTNEMEQCNRIADFSKIALERCGFSVKKSKQGQAMAKSISESNNWYADLHIPIHTNAFNGKVTGGTLVMLYDDNAENVKAGKSILNAVAPLSPGSDYTLRYRPELAELNSTRCTSVYLEVEFHDTKEGAKWIVENAEKIGEAIAKGVCNYFGVKYVNKATETPKKAESFEMALLQALLRQACVQGLCKTFIKPIDNKDNSSVSKAVMECRTSLGYKNVDDSIDLDFIKELEHEINVVRIAKEDALKAELDSIMIGDFNKDGKVDVKDATAIQKHIAGIEV